MKELEALWQPVAIGPVTTLNRVVLAAHTTGFRGARYGDYLAERARGGAGLLITGAIPTHPTSDAGFTPRGWRKDAIPEIRQVVSAVHLEGRPLIVQLGHFGVQGTGAQSLPERGVLFAPSAVPSPVFGVAPKVMSTDDIAEVIEGFARTARNTREAGADGVEIHAAHGYLLSSFLSPLTNHRTDEYGGDSARRARLIVEIGQAIRDVCGTDFVVGLKLNSDEFVGESGITPAEAEETIRIAHAARLFDYFSISGGNYHSFHYLVAPASSELNGHLAADAERARRAVNYEVPVMVTGRIRVITHAAEIVKRGQADLVGMIRAQIADPELVSKAQAGRLGEIRRCVGANQGCWRRVSSMGEISCTVNPVTGREAKWGRAQKQPANRRRVLIVGGGPAGMKLAETAAARRRDVTLVEQESALGGQIRYAGLLPHRSPWLDLVNDLTASIGRLGVDIRLEAPMTSSEIRDFGADLVYTATGSTWDSSGCSARRVGPAFIPRTEGSVVLDPIQAIRLGEACPQHMAIIDDNSDYLPLGLAEHLALLGKTVVVVTSFEAVGTRLGPEATVDFAWVYPRLLQQGVRIITSSHLDQIERDRIVISRAWEEGVSELRADGVVLCMMRHSNERLYQELRENGVNVRRIGDCVAPREVDDALFESVREGVAM